MALAARLQRFHCAVSARQPPLLARVSQIPAAQPRRPRSLRKRCHRTLWDHGFCRAHLFCRRVHPPSHFFFWSHHGHLALTRLWGNKDHSVEVEEMLEEKVALQNIQSRSVMELFRERSICWQLITIIVTFFSLQLSGINAVSRQCSLQQ